MFGENECVRPRYSALNKQVSGTVTRSALLRYAMLCGSGGRSYALADGARVVEKKMVVSGLFCSLFVFYVLQTVVMRTKYVLRVTV